MNSNIYSISQLEEKESMMLMEELQSEFPHINVVEEVQEVVSKTNCSTVEALEYVVTNNPILWGKVYLGWSCRDYQIEILYEGKNSKKVVLRLGRRLGKTDSMCVLILWYAYTQFNKGPNDEQYNILILTPYESQIDLIFDRLSQLIDSSPLLKGMLSREIYHRKEFLNGTILKGMTAGASSGTTGSNNTRGERADLIILDEVDYIGSNQITNILNIANEAPERIKIMAASTPSGKHDEFYKWCTGSSKSYRAKKEDIENFVFTGYEKTERSKDPTSDNRGNGWTEVYAPSIVNKELLKINPDTGQTYLQDIKDELSELRFEQEVMAEFGDEELGVYQRKYLKAALDEGERIRHKYTTDMSEYEFTQWLRRRHEKIVILGVDWDKSFSI